MALEDRRDEVIRLPANHYSRHAVGSVLLLVAAFEAWLNEVLSEVLFTCGHERLKGLADEPLLSKYYGIPQRVANVDMPRNGELGLLIDVRHEIAHYLPRVLVDEGNVPTWLVELHRRQLFLYSSMPRFKAQTQAPLGWNLASYRLAYWAWETVDGAIAELLGPLSEQANCNPSTAANFRSYRMLCAPSGLAQYDREHNLQLTYPTKREDKKEDGG